MPLADPKPDNASCAAFMGLCGKRAWSARLGEIAARAQPGSLSARATQQRHALELALARLGDPTRPAATPVERHIAGYAREAVRLADRLPKDRRCQLKDRIAAALTGAGTLIPVFHLLRTAATLRARGFDIHHAGLLDEAPFDLVITRDGATAEVACETVSAEEGRPVHRGDWCALVDRVNPELQSWLAAHPGRYLLKMTLPDGMAGAGGIADLHARITGMLMADKRQDTGAQAVLKLDPLMLAGAQAQDRPVAGLPARLRAQFGPEAHLAVTTEAGSGSVFVMAARAGRENEIAAAICRRLATAAATRLSGTRPGILAVFVEDLDRPEWRTLRESLELEGAVRRFLTTTGARRVVAVSCTSRAELFGIAPPDGVAEGELRFRNQAHPAAKLAGLAPAVASSV